MGDRGVRSGGRPTRAPVILLSIVTLGIYTYIWTYRQFEDFKKYSGDGLGGTVGVILGIFINPVVWFLIPAELQGNLYEREGEECPVSALSGPVVPAADRRRTSSGT